MSFNVALSGLNAANTDLATLSNNIANANTVGFKGSRAEFGDFYRESSFDLSATNSGFGVRVDRIAQQFAQGTINNTGKSLDLAISGDGFFTMSDKGTRVYTRAGAFSTDRNGYVVSSGGARLQVYPPSGTSGTFNTAAPVDLHISGSTNPPAASKAITASVNLPASAAVPTTTPFSASDASSYNKTTSLTVYDSLGTPHTASLYYAKTATAGEWTLHTTVDGTEVGTGTAVSFDTSGTLTSPASGQITLNPLTLPNGSAPLALTLDVADSTQYGDSFTVGTLSQDGYAAGELSGLTITDAGVVQARYSNGQLTPLGQIMMTLFPDQQGLQQLGSATWAETFVSGQPIAGTAGSANFGAVQSGALEASNVDLTEQLVNMMTAQRNYQANSQVISTADEMLQTIMNLR
ncbi:MAG: flagellar hook protein FlgE [Hydrocarboniphaga sp.]|uniref:flagellar hook protein FlgE n=1 Tax=Hydrocarboniphaga sp. TaxID=2033016 RepID=UPI002623D739|nr:flagellar hook protein FlgE [Hydrocarboniphaga sp.]MDB5967594.1 flagellar hook protein FlgE [Hydrocarboniphaga sp.]